MNKNMNALQGIDDVAWGKLKHAYGTAEDVPALLRSLLNKDPNERQEAWDQLYGNLWHQGTVYEVTSHAVPFLARLAISESTPQRVNILVYLASLYLGTSYLEVHGNALKLKPAEYESRLAEELEQVRKVRNAIDAFAAQFSELLQSGDSAVRFAAAYLLGLTRVSYVGEDESQIDVVEEIHKAALGENGG
jgi:hypothetical protein